MQLFFCALRYIMSRLSRVEGQRSGCQSAQTNVLPLFPSPPWHVCRRTAAHRLFLILLFQTILTLAICSCGCTIFKPAYDSHGHDYEPTHCVCPRSVSSSPPRLAVWRSGPQMQQKHVPGAGGGGAASTSGRSREESALYSD